MARVGQRTGIGSADAVIVAAQRQGGGLGQAPEADGMGNALTDAATKVGDLLTSGAVSDAVAQADRLETFLKVSIGCSLLASGLCVLLFFQRR